MASEITVVLIVYLNRSKKTSEPALRHWPFCGEFTGDRWIPLTKGQERGNCFQLMTSSCEQLLAGWSKTIYLWFKKLGDKIVTGYTLVYHTWHLYMMTTSNGNIFRVAGTLWGESTGDRWIPSHRPVWWSVDVFFDVRLNKQLSRQLIRWWFETQSRSLWRHCNDLATKCSSFYFFFYTAKNLIAWSVVWKYSNARPSFQ